MWHLCYKRYHRRILIRSIPNVLDQKIALDRRVKSRSRFFGKTLKKSRKRLIRYGLLTANIALLAAVLMVVNNGNDTNSTGQRNAALFGNNATAETVTNPLDQLSSADIAVNVAHMTALPETTAVENHADSFNATLTTQRAQEDAIISKPQIVATAAAKSKKDIIKYVTVDGDTVTNIAQRFGVTSDSIRWSNGLTSDRVAIGKELVFLPGVNGIVYTVKSGDTPDSLAQKYNTNKEQIIAFNDAEISGLKIGEQIIIPNGVQPATRATSGSYMNFAWGGFSAVYSSNGYDYGWCTWWAAKRRADIGRPIPSNLGNAITWASLAARAGHAVDNTPESGAVAYYRTIGGLGHVGFVEQVNPDGSIWISDMNYMGVSEIGGSTPAGGWGRRSFHMVTPDNFSRFYFIH